jgi:hypothetical protein
MSKVSHRSFALAAVTCGLLAPAAAIFLPHSLLIVPTPWAALQFTGSREVVDYWGGDPGVSRSV